MPDQKQTSDVKPSPYPEGVVALATRSPLAGEFFFRDQMVQQADSGWAGVVMTIVGPAEGYEFRRPGTLGEQVMVRAAHGDPATGFVVTRKFDNAKPVVAVFTVGNAHDESLLRQQLQATPGFVAFEEKQ